MIHKIKTITYQLRSHSFVTYLSSEGKVTETTQLFVSPSNWTKGYVKRLARHLLDIANLITQLQKEQAAKKDPMLDVSSTAYSRCTLLHAQEAKK